MMRLLDQMCVFFSHVTLVNYNVLFNSEHLKSVPDLLETLMSEKRLLQASVLLVRSLKMINGQDMLEIGAVSDLRGYLVGQETVGLIFLWLIELLIEPIWGVVGSTRNFDRRTT